MATDTQAVVTEIADIMRRVGKRDEVVDNIAENVDFSDLIAEQLKVDGPVKEQAVKAITQYLKGYEIDSDSDDATAILEAIDFSKFIPTLLQNKDFQEVVTDAISDALENGNLDVSEQITNLIEDKDVEKLLNTEDTKEAIAKKLKAYVDDYDMSNMSEDVLEKLDEVVFSPSRLQAVLANNEDLDELVMKKVTDYLESTDADDENNPIATAVSESKTFQNAVDKAIENLVDSGKVTRLVEKVATDMLSGDDSGLRDKLTQAISAQLVNKIAGSIVAQAFK